MKPGGPQATGRVLVVDDDFEVAGYLAAVLRREGYTVEVAPDFTEAVERLQASSFDAVVSDIDLPDGDGISLVGRAAEVRPGLRVVVITGHAGYDQAVRALHAGAYDFLAKPIRKDALLGAVRRAVEARCLEAHNLQLVARLAARVSALGDMLDIAREVSGSLELDRVLARALDRTIGFLGGEAGSILLAQEDGSLRFAIVRGGPSPDALVGTSVPAGAGVAGWVASRGRSLVIRDVRRDPRFFPVEEKSGCATRSILASPLVSKGRLVGVIEVINCRRGKFTRDDRVAVETLACSIAAAIENATVTQELAQSRVLLVEYSRNLEAKVDERTAALKRSFTELEVAHRHLEAAKDQVVRAEKMASIGCIAAGVAHEINNPIGFINSNLQTLRGYVAELAPIVSELRATAKPGPALEERIRRADLDFVMGDIETLVRESEDGVRRVVKIVKDLKTFSNVRKGAPEWADLNECIESAISLARNETKYVADVRTELAALPRVEAWPTEITQVLVNVIVNAAHAIQRIGVPFTDESEREPDRTGTITVRSRQDADAVLLEVVDDGCGIPAEIRSRIFDPFFTTKDPGRGTGLGLSLSYEIVERHRGAIAVTSDVGRGTTFSIRIPRTQPRHAELPIAIGR